MPQRPLLLALLVLALTAPAAGAQVGPPAPAKAPVQTPTPRALYHDGYTQRYLLGPGGWLFRGDELDVGVERRFYRQASTRGWRSTTAPNAFNAGDDSEESQFGGVGWYRKEFRVPAAAATAAWLVRFEAVNNRARVWLNGRELGTEHVGVFLPWERQLTGLVRGGVNRLVVRVDSRREPTDFPPSVETANGQPAGGWWNYGGLLREVYLRRVDRVDLRDVVVRPSVTCRTCAARVDVSATAVNLSGAPVRAQVRARYGAQRVLVGTAVLRPGQRRLLRQTLRVDSPRLWSPRNPHLYAASVDASAGAAAGGPLRPAASFVLRSGIRSVRVEPTSGRLELNFEPASPRGVGVHEDDPVRGFAVDNRIRERIVRQARELGATMLRAHYPLSPYLHELADRQGLLIWSEIPVYSLRTGAFNQSAVRTAARTLLRENIIDNGNHPSVAIWSIGNELASRPEGGLEDYLSEAPRVAHRLDPTRPVGLAIVSYPTAGCQPAYAGLDVIGLNEYFGWYAGPDGQVADRDLLSGFLDQQRACWPHKALMVTEFGFEANRNGPVEERGTHAFQQDAIDFHTQVLNAKPWLSGALYWTLQEFRVRPNWSGGNPKPTPPLHQKAVVDFQGRRKPGWENLRRGFAVPQYGLAAIAPGAPAGVR